MRRGTQYKKERFAEEYLKDLNASQAALRAGYKHVRAAHRLMSDPYVQSIIKSLQELRSARTEITQDWVLEGIRDNYHRAMQAEPVVTKDGPTGEFTYEGHVATKCLELAGKHLGMFKDVLKHEGDLPALVVKRGE